MNLVNAMVCDYLAQPLMLCRTKQGRYEIPYYIRNNKNSKPTTTGVYACRSVLHAEQFLNDMTFGAVQN